MSTVESGVGSKVAEMERWESAGLEVFAEFDLAQACAADGQLSCAERLMWKAAMRPGDGL